MIVRIHFPHITRFSIYAIIISMNPRNLVKDTLEFASPNRIPRQLWYLPWAVDHYPHELAAIQRQYPDDLVGAPACLKEPLKTSGDQYQAGDYVDEWGCRFRSIQPGVIGEVKEALLKDYEEMDHLHTPDALLSVDVEQVNAFCQATERFVLAGVCPNPFERIQYIRKPENIYIDLMEDQDGVKTLLDKVHQFNLKVFDVWAKTEVDAFTWNDDWGAQRALLISPKLWRQIFKPIYKDYVDLAHRHGKYAFMHSDGYIADIIPDLIEIGVDALNSQLFCMDIEALGRRYAGRLTFWGEIDRQRLLAFASPAEVAAAVERVRSALYHRGGVIAQCEFGAGARPENVAQVFQSWNE
jgi:uroporphyrinogen decarboxylase